MKNSKDKYIARSALLPATTAITITDIAMKVPKIVLALNRTFLQTAAGVKPIWRNYKVSTEDNIALITNEHCSRCGKVFLYPAQRKIRVYMDIDIGPIYLDEGYCKDCMNVSKYLDKYLFSDLTTAYIPDEKEAKEQFYKYAGEYERAWRLVIATAPRIAMTQQEWEHRCKFFGGCAICGGPIETQAKYFPTFLNGAHTAWNIIPLCKECLDKHYRGRINKERKVSRYKVFSTHVAFQKTKTIRMYLMHQMFKHSLYMEPLEPYRKRFFETRVLEGAD